MTLQHRANGTKDEVIIYEISVKGQLGSKWASWFAEMQIATSDNNTTCLTGPVVDQAALYGLLKKIRDLGLPLISVNQIKSTN